MRGENVMLSEKEVEQALQGSLVVYPRPGGNYYGQVTRRDSQGRGLWFQGGNRRGDLLKGFVMQGGLALPRILSLSEIRSAMKKERLVKLTLWNAPYIYEGPVIKELNSTETPDGENIPMFCFSGKMLWTEGVQGNFPVRPGQLFE